jgi:multidrug efflux pump subunit AcrA (membrane-fusion protein)
MGSSKGPIVVTGDPRIRRKLQQTNLGENHNKWYLVEAWDAAAGLALAESIDAEIAALSPEARAKLAPEWESLAVKRARKALADAKVALDIAVGAAERSAARAAVQAARAALDAAKLAAGIVEPEPDES